MDEAVVKLKIGLEKIYYLFTVIVKCTFECCFNGIQTH